MEAASEFASSSSEENTFEEFRNESISLDSSTDGLPEVATGEAGLLFTGEGLGASGVSMTQFLTCMNMVLLLTTSCRRNGHIDNF